jgi:hypothetical protein
MIRNLADLLSLDNCRFTYNAGTEDVQMSPQHLLCDESLPYNFVAKRKWKNVTSCEMETF